MASGLDGLIRRHDGIPWAAPAVSEERVHFGTHERAALRALAAGDFDIVVLLTGTGAERLLAELDAIALDPRVRERFATCTVVARGPKPAFLLRRHGLAADVVVPEPNTTYELLETMGRLPLAGRRVLVVSAGERATEPMRSLVDRGANVVELQLYRWTLPSDGAARLAETVDALVAGRIDTALFTSQIQVRHLYEIADRRGLGGALSLVLRDRVLVGAVGPTCADALYARGIEPGVVPDHPKMGHLVRAAAVACASRARSAIPRQGVGA